MATTDSEVSSAPRREPRFCVDLLADDSLR